MPSEPYDIVFDSEIEQHLHAIDRKFHDLIHQAIDEQLQYQAEVETKNRKRLREPAAFGATWEIRFGPDNRFRVLYRIESPRQVVVVAIGTKQRNRLWVGEKEIQL
ncbi:MAG TPA: type II toxin-antitoxin system RelE/ParE family toxin [Planctomycetaceae bacterium]|nr:type II toxin-antitoxin system RelE/ParE family toxin [Planctomycetaceae bacterium]